MARSVSSGIAESRHRTSSATGGRKNLAGIFHDLDDDVPADEVSRKLNLPMDLVYSAKARFLKRLESEIRMLGDDCGWIETALGLPQDLVTICEKALTLDPQTRYATAGDLAADLARLRSGEPILARPASLFRKLGFRIRRNRTGLLIAGAVASLLLAIASWGLISHLESRQQSRRSIEIERRAEVNRQRLCFGLFAFGANPNGLG